LPLNIVKNQPINIWLTIIIACVSSLPQQIKLFGFNRALTLNVAIYIAIAIVGGVANKLMNFYPRFRATFFVSASLLLQITIPISVHFRNQWIPGISGTGWQVSQFFSGLALLLLTSGFGGWFSLQEKLNMNFREELQQRHIDLIAVSRQFAYATREASKLLHGQVQSKLVACAMAIDVAAQSGDENKIKDAVQSALRIITSPLSSSVVASNLLEELNRKASLWGEICSIEIEVGDHLSTLTSDQVVQLGRVVEEGISNAIRHGRAKKIVIAVKRVSPDSISVKILDNGVGPQNGQPSMGSALIGQASGGNWTLEAVENGTLLSMKTRG
jgi:signal transduction histidine kinase